ncbi:hypothetical protein [Flavobacterium eburneipallidum]|uniref:hypothetical protein n=1 Tax=Flavobacterium eburneipallidum TaxID=3003263 RepID=UPI002482401C|nr:hypothetical protein [Flavobacterium eburneipallidum]
MVVLKKIKSATLVEVIIASLLIVIIFMIASLVLNNLVMNTFSKNRHPIETRLNVLEYKLQNDLIELPYQESYRNWDIEIQLEEKASKKELLIQATQNQNDKEIIRHRLYDKS